MTASTVCEPLGEIGIAVPTPALGRIGAINAGVKEEQLPAVLQCAHVKRERQCVGLRRLPHRGKSHQVGVERADILIRYAREVIERKNWKELRAIARHPLVQGARKGVPGPVSDTCRWIRRDVRGINRAEWRTDRESARERLATLRRVT